jgi:hypothetical protein
MLVCLLVCLRADSLASALSVVSVQLLRLPNVACIQPEVSFYTCAPSVCLCSAQRSAKVLTLTRLRQHTRVQPQRF